MKILEIGPGEHPIPNADTLDCVGNPTYEAQWGEGKLPIKGLQYDKVFASHVLEHVPWHQTHQALHEVMRVLKVGGEFEVWVPNFQYIIECYLVGACGDKWRKHNPSGDPMKWVNGRIFTYGPGAENYHRATFDPEYLKQCLEDTGFKSVTRILRRKHGVSHGPIDLGFKAYK